MGGKWQVMGEGVKSEDMEEMNLSAAQHSISPITVRGCESFYF